MYCPHCLKFINEVDPEICPYCGNPQKTQKTSKQKRVSKEKPSKKPIYKRIWFWVLVVFIIFTIGGKITQPKITKYHYIAAAENVISDHLKAPATAVFCDASKYTVAISEQDGLAMVGGYVDSENGFGAMIRSEFTVELKLVDPKSQKIEWVCIEIDDKEYGAFVDSDTFEIVQK